MTESFTHIVTADQQGIRLDTLVANLGIEAIASRSAVVRLIKEKEMTV